MTPERQQQLREGKGHLSLEEVKEGWHYCRDEDYHLILAGPGIECSCLLPKMCPTCED